LRRGLAVVALLLSLAAPAAAQTPARVHLSFGYRYLLARSINRSGSQQSGLKRLPVGGEAGLTVRVAPLLTLVGAIGHSSAGAISVLGGFGSPSSNQMGTVSFSVTDIMGGVKVSRLGTGPFVELLAGASMPGAAFQDVRSAYQYSYSLDQGRDKSFALRPMAGIDFGQPSQRTGGRIEAGWDIIPGAERVTATSVQSVTITHFRLAASVTVAVGR